MFHHRIENLFIGNVFSREAEVLGQGFLVPESLARADSSTLIESLQFLAAGGRFQIFDDGYVRAYIG